MAENLRYLPFVRYQRKCCHFGVLAAREKKTYKKVCFFVVVRRHRIQPPSQAGAGFGLGSGSPVWFLPKLGRRGIKLLRHQGPTAGGVIINHAAYWARLVALCPALSEPFVTTPTALYSCRRGCISCRDRRLNEKPLPISYEMMILIDVTVRVLVPMCPCTAKHQHWQR